LVGNYDGLVFEKSFNMYISNTNPKTRTITESIFKIDKLRSISSGPITTIDYKREFDTLHVGFLKENENSMHLCISANAKMEHESEFTLSNRFYY